MTTDLQTFALTSHWLETAAPQLPQASTNTITTAMTYNWTPSVWYPGSSYWYCQPVADHRPIKLGLSEIEKLRAAAKRDAKLKAILEKFTDQIEVVVDFK